MPKGSELSGEATADLPDQIIPNDPRVPKEILTSGYLKVGMHPPQGQSFNFWLKHAENNFPAWQQQQAQQQAQQFAWQQQQQQQAAQRSQIDPGWLQNLAARLGQQVQMVTLSGDGPGFHFVPDQVFEPQYDAIPRQVATEDYVDMERRVLLGGQVIPRDVFHKVAELYQQQQLHDSVVMKPGASEHILDEEALTNVRRTSTEMMLKLCCLMLARCLMTYKIDAKEEHLAEALDVVQLAEGLQQRPLFVEVSALYRANFYVHCITICQHLMDRPDILSDRQLVTNPQAKLDAVEEDIKRLKRENSVDADLSSYIAFRRAFGLSISGKYERALLQYNQLRRELSPESPHAMSQANKAHAMYWLKAVVNANKMVSRIIQDRYQERTKLLIADTDFYRRHVDLFITELRLIAESLGIYCDKFPDDKSLGDVLRRLHSSVMEFVNVSVEQVITDPEDRCKLQLDTMNILAPIFAQDAHIACHFEETDPAKQEYRGLWVSAKVKNVKLAKQYTKLVKEREVAEQKQAQTEAEQATDLAVRDGEAREAARSLIEQLEQEHQAMVTAQQAKKERAKECARRMIKAPVVATSDVDTGEHPVEKKETAKPLSPQEATLQEAAEVHIRWLDYEDGLEYGAVIGAYQAAYDIAAASSDLVIMCQVSYQQAAVLREQVLYLVEAMSSSQHSDHGKILDDIKALYDKSVEYLTLSRQHLAKIERSHQHYDDCEVAIRMVDEDSRDAIKRRQDLIAKAGPELEKLEHSKVSRQRYMEQEGRPWKDNPSVTRGPDGRLHGISAKAQRTHTLRDIVKQGPAVELLSRLLPPPTSSVDAQYIEHGVVPIVQTLLVEGEG